MREDEQNREVIEEREMMPEIKRERGQRENRGGRGGQGRMEAGVGSSS